MKDDYKDFYHINDSLTEDQVDEIIEAYNELIESIITEFKHQTAAEKMKKEKYRNSAAGKKALAKYEKKTERAGYKANAKLSKLMKKVAKFRNDPVSEGVDFGLCSDYVVNNLSETELNTLFSLNPERMTEDQVRVYEKALSLCHESGEYEPSDDEVLEQLSIEELAELDDMVEQVCQFCEACDDTPNIDPDTGEEITEFKHQTAAEKMKREVWKRSASGKKSLAKSLRRASKPHKVDAKRSALMKKVAKFRKNPNESSDMSFLDDYLSIVMEADEVIDDLREAGIDIDELKEACKARNESNEVTIMIPLDDENAISDAADEADVEIVKMDNEEGSCLVKGEVENLRHFLDKMNYEDSVDDLTVSQSNGICPCDDEDDDDYDVDEAFKRHSMADRMKQRQVYKKIKNKSWFKRARAKYDRKSSRDNYRVDRTRSREMQKIAKTRIESIENLLDESFKTSPIFGSLNEGQSNELKAMFTDTVSKTLLDSYAAIERDVREGYEAYINKGLVPTMLEYFDDYKNTIVVELYEWVDEYLRHIAEEFVDENMDRKMFVKSSKSERLESFSEKLLSLIKEELKIYPEQEDALESAKESISKLSSDLREANISLIRERNKTLEAEKNAHMYEALQESTASDSTKDEIIEYAKSNLLDSSVSMYDFRKKISSMLSESQNDSNKQKKAKESVTENEDFDFLKMFNRN